MYQVSDIEILIATMNRDNLAFLEVMFSKTDVTKYNILIINQTTTEKQLHTTSHTINVINVLDKGLSKSRNLALQHATKKLVVFTDDDVVLVPGVPAGPAQGWYANSKLNANLNINGGEGDDTIVGGGGSDALNGGDAAASLALLRSQPFTEPFETIGRYILPSVAASARAGRPSRCAIAPPRRWR